MKNWGRLLTAMVTPFDSKLNVDYDKAVELANKLVEQGNTALVICGTTGETPTLTRQEKMNLLKIIKEKVNVPIIAGIGTNCTLTTIENGKDAISCGVDGLLVVVPYYNKPDQDSMYEHFKIVAESLDCPIILYNVPGRTGVNMLPSTVAKLSKIENIVALKEASGNIVQFSEMVQKTPKNFLVYTGDDVLTLPGLAVGGYGVISVSAHIVSAKMKEMIDCFVAGNVDRATELHLELLNINQNLFMVTNPIPVKAALNMMGINVGGVRLPLTEANPTVKAQIQKDMRELGLV
ncbi:MAG TPA: 4-hydroxy-tetrahydrodipicolinate synthase [Anaerovoracaceae bacterium]|nr:4-hydroxy-tetrahydrodipicolinate synthase [Anaerovoracaceae bacterium]